MKKLFYIGLIGLIAFEIANVYFIMPMPGSQQMNSIDFAYFLYAWRWFFRVLFTFLLLFGLFKANWKRKWTLLFPLAILGFITYETNFEMAADVMFQQVKKVDLATVNKNKVDLNRLVIGVEIDGIAKAYPINYLAYHHFVSDSINSQAFLVSYCSVCRTGRVFDPHINGKIGQFRLVGMDHFNAMIEDATTKSWWQQSTGIAVAGELKGSALKELYCSQTSLKKWLELHPTSLIMQADKASIQNYSTSFKYESGESKSTLTGTNRASWKNKSWVIGVKVNKESIAFDWNELLEKRIVSSKLDNTNLFVVLASDNKSFFAFKNYSTSLPRIQNDTIYIEAKKYTINGKGIDTTFQLKPVKAYQEFWHSWKTFQPTTSKK